jgi:hypothetical protein
LLTGILSKDAKLFPHHKACKSIQLKGLGMKIILHRYLFLRHTLRG